MNTLWLAVMIGYPLNRADIVRPRKRPLCRSGSSFLSWHNARVCPWFVVFPFKKRSVSGGNCSQLTSFTDTVTPSGWIDTES